MGGGGEERGGETRGKGWGQGEGMERDGEGEGTGRGGGMEDMGIMGCE